jgi:hypothetical protein
MEDACSRLSATDHCTIIFDLPTELEKLLRNDGDLPNAVVTLLDKANDVLYRSLWEPR